MPSRSTPRDVSILFRGFTPPHSRGWWKRRVERMLELCGESGELAVVFTDDETIRRLNRTYRKTDRATDVLAFEAGGPACGEARIIGDVVIGGGQAHRNARRYKNSLEAELLKLIVHGLLHLLGHDHETAGGEMARTERTILEKVTSSALSGRRTRG